jgi:hypothetical protein
MTTQLSPLAQKLCTILQRSFVEARNLALAQRYQQLHDLTDTFEIVPELLSRGNEDLGRIRTLLASYQSKYRGAASDYLAILNMDDATFESMYLGPWSWQEPGTSNGAEISTEVKESLG